MALLYAPEHPGHPPGPLATRRALATGLVGIELAEPKRRVDNAVRLVEHDHGLGPQQRARSSDLVEAHLHVEVIRREVGGGRPSGRPSLDLLAVPDASGKLLDQLASRSTHWR